MRRVEFLSKCGAPVFEPTSRVGRPRMKWTVECYSQAWQAVVGGAGRYSVGRHTIEEAVMPAALERRF